MSLSYSCPLSSPSSTCHPRHVCKPSIVVVFPTHSQPTPFHIALEPEFLPIISSSSYWRSPDSSLGVSPFHVRGPRHCPPHVLALVLQVSAPGAWFGRATDAITTGGPLRVSRSEVINPGSESALDESDVAAESERRADISKLPTSILPHKIPSIVPETLSVAAPAAPSLSPVSLSVTTASTPSIPNTSPTTVADLASLIPKTIGHESTATIGTNIPDASPSPTSTPGGAAADDDGDETPDTNNDGSN
ncbi:hypothetical protein BD413DRAFT_249811 [Trametes elegans]|nr:hypothetical protein BD413DRAFT_249811 [Trametes elegans]